MNEEALNEQELGGEIQTKAQLEAFYSEGYRSCGAAYLRVILILFVYFWNYGFLESTGVLSAVSGFAIPCFYILSGYFILTGDRKKSTEKTKRKIKRSFLCLAFMFVLYITINLIVCRDRMSMSIFSPRTVFNFLLLNLWPLSIGSNIWFMQAMLYAYIVILIAEKLGLMRFYKAVMILLFIFMLLSGEFSRLVHFDILGYQYIPGNWFTRALPYILLGKFLREKQDIILRTSAWKFIAVWIIGAGLSLGEIILLGQTGFLEYEGHMIGYSIMALAACGLALSRPLGSERKLTAFLTRFDPILSGLIYILIDPVFYIIGLSLGSGYITLFTRFGGLAAYAISLLLALMLKKTKLFRAFFS